MSRPSKVSLSVIIAILCLIIVILLVYVSVNDTMTLREERVELFDKIEYLEGQVEQKDFAYTAASMEIDNLEQVIASKDELILELKVDKEINDKTLTVLKVAVIYIQEMQGKMDHYDIAYPEFIFDTILDDSYYEEIEEQVEYFEGVEE